MRVLETDGVLNAQDRGHAGNAQAEVSEPKGGFRLHADLLAIKGRCGLPGDASGRASNRQIADKLERSGASLGQWEGQTAQFAGDKHCRRMALGLQRVPADVIIPSIPITAQRSEVDREAGIAGAYTALSIEEEATVDGAVVPTASLGKLMPADCSRTR